MIVFIALKPDKTLFGGPYASMGEAQHAIASAEPDVLKQGLYQIHPIGSRSDAERLNLKLHIHYRLEKFDGAFVGQAPVEVIEGEG